MGALLVSAALMGSFSIETDVLDAVSGGPKIVTVTVTYTGARPLRVWRFPAIEVIDVRLPPGSNLVYFKRNRVNFYFGPGPSVMEMRTGHKESRTFQLHQQLLALDSMPEWNLIFSFHLTLVQGLSDDPGQVITISKRSCLRIEPFSDSFLRKLKADIDLATTGRRAGVATDGTGVQRQADRIIGTFHPSLAPFAVDLLRAGPEQSTRWRLREYLWNNAQGVGLLHACDTNTVQSGTSSALVLCEMFEDYRRRELSHVDNIGSHLTVLQRWAKELTNQVRDIVVTDTHEQFLTLLRLPQQRLPESNLQVMRSVKPLWLRAFVYVTFSDRLPYEWRAAYLKEMEERVRPLPADQVKQWIDELGSEDFQEREKAVSVR